MSTPVRPVLSSTAHASLREVIASPREKPVPTLLVGGTAADRKLAAATIAKGLRMSLLRVALAEVTSKYIGETEKRLTQVFESATAQDAVLFFDEADALFGKRSNVKDSHDRFANIDTAAVLDRLATAPVPVLVASDGEQAIAELFLRRFRYVVRLGS